MSSGLLLRAAVRVLAVVLALLAGVVLAAPVGVASSAFPVPEVDRIGPGVQLVTHGVPCTAAFAFRDRAGRTYLGYAARCASPAGRLAGNGCRHRSWPLGTPVRVAMDAVRGRRGQTLARGVLRYSSWAAMHRAATHDLRVCRNNDFALVQVLGRGSRSVSPTLDYWDGPGGVGSLPAPGAAMFGCTGMVASGVRGLNPDVATLRQTWRWGAGIAPVRGLRSDVGAGYVDDQGRAAGILLAAPDGQRRLVASLSLAMRFARHHGVGGLRLVPGASPFHPSAVA